MINYRLRYVTNCLKYRTIKGLCFNYIDFTLSAPDNNCSKPSLQWQKTVTLNQWRLGYYDSKLWWQNSVSSSL